MLMSSRCDSGETRFKLVARDADEQRLLSVPTKTEPNLSYYYRPLTRRIIVCALFTRCPRLRIFLPYREHLRRQFLRLSSHITHTMASTGVNVRLAPLPLASIK